MTNHSLRIDAHRHRTRARCVRLLGIQLRELREQRGWTRDEMLRATGLDMAQQTLATYELGTRVMSVPRLFELADALGVLPQELIARVHLRLYPDNADVVTVDLRCLAREQRPELASARAWAAAELKHLHLRPGHPSLMSLSADAIAQLAGLCGVNRHVLTAALRSPRLAESAA
jgi:transcriptional regulator with XRE-family HTH domain